MSPQCLWDNVGRRQGIHLNDLGSLLGFIAVLGNVAAGGRVQQTLLRAPLLTRFLSCNALRHCYDILNWDP